MTGVASGIALWGLHLGLTQGVLAMLIADTAPPELRGMGYGMFNFTSGLALLAANILAGAFWDLVGPASPFLAGAGFATAALVSLALLKRR
jgi:MFS family permease